MSQRTIDPSVPSEPFASPAAHRPRDPRSVRWYLPTWGERLRLMGWRNVLWLAPVGALALVGFALLFARHAWWMVMSWWKLLALAVGLPLGAASRQASAALRRRDDPFCIHCGYSLAGLADGHACPECGEVTAHATCREYQRDPQAFVERFNARGSIPPPDAPVDVPRDASRQAGDGT